MFPPLRRLPPTPRLGRDKTTRQVMFDVNDGVPVRQPTLIKTELFADRLCKRVLDLSVPRYRRNSPVHWIRVKIVICTVAFEVAAAFSEAPHQLIRSSPNSLPLPSRLCRLCRSPRSLHSRRFTARSPFHVFRSEQMCFQRRRRRSSDMRLGSSPEVPLVSLPGSLLRASL